MSIFGRLNYDSSFQNEHVTPMSESVKKHMDGMPPLLNDWQKADVATSNTANYHKNPVGTITQNIWDLANTIAVIPHLEATNANAILTSANTLIISANNFMQHTNRMSGVSGASADDPTLPTYESAMGVGKMLTYIVYQTDGVQNNAPIMGNFTSICSSNNLISYYSNVYPYLANTAKSIVTLTTEDGEGGYVTTYTSNLSQTIINQMASDLSNVATFMNTRRTADVTFYTNSQSVINDYNKVTKFSDMGSTESGLMNNLIGSDKLKDRLNS